MCLNESTRFCAIVSHLKKAFVKYKMDKSFLIQFKSAYISPINFQEDIFDYILAIILVSVRVIASIISIKKKTTVTVVEFAENIVALTSNTFLMLFNGGHACRYLLLISRNRSAVVGQN